MNASVDLSSALAKQQLCRALTSPIQLPAGLDALDIEVIGEGNIGEKAQQLREKTSLLRQIGFYTPRRIFLAEGFFNAFFERNGLGVTLGEVGACSGAEQRIRRGSLTRDQFNTVQAICSSLRGEPLAIRSSAQGDARGTGIYQSEVADGSIGSVRRAIQNVLGSYFSPAAIDFRRDAHTGEGFGIIVEPLIGQDIDGCLFAPILSGFGYTSTSRGGSYINVVPGLGGGVDTRDGERITREAITAVNGELHEYIDVELEAFLNGLKKRPSTLLRTGDDLLTDFYSGKAYVAPTSWKKYGYVQKARIAFEGDVERDFKSLNLTTFFEMIDRLERALGKPQYFEWAMTIENQQPKIWITQIADIDKRLDMLDFNDLGEVIFSGYSVTGTGDKTCGKVACCWNTDDVAKLHNFNKHNSNYVLLFSSRLTSASYGGIRQLQYDDFSNASVFLEIQDVGHIGDPVAHLGGQLDMAGKFFAVVDSSEASPPNWELFGSKEATEHGLKVYQGKVRVLSSERQNKLIVSTTTDD